MTSSEISEQLNRHSLLLFGTSFSKANRKEARLVLQNFTRERILSKKEKFEEKTKEEKKIHYLSMEFLIGKTLKANLFSLGLLPNLRNALSRSGYSEEEIDALFEEETEPSLGNGGLGRLGAALLDAAATLEIPICGYSLLYECGLFRQKIISARQREFPDEWLEEGENRLVPREEEKIEVHFGGRASLVQGKDSLEVVEEGFERVLAVPCDLLLPGFESDGITSICLWKAKAPSGIDMEAFSNGNYTKALEEETKAGLLCKTLYPGDHHLAGKRLRLRQQYFLVSATLQSILRRHIKTCGTVENLHEKNAVHINDTHPALAVPELMRLLLDDFALSWENAWEITKKTIFFTNHTTLPEALEKWNKNLFAEQLPRIFQITEEIDKRARIEFLQKGVSHEDIEKLAPISGGEVHMARLCALSAGKINGVSELHTEILKNELFRGTFSLYPEKFESITNGISHRRWLCLDNPKLDELIVDCIGEGFRKNPEELPRLLAFRDDKGVLDRLLQIKAENKAQLSSFIQKQTGIAVNPESVFDSQIKRLHEYKRQLLNALQILRTALFLKENPRADFVPRTFLFAAKAAPNYYFAKEVIHLIVKIGEFCRKDAVLRDKLCVVFLEDYRLSLAEKIIPATEISEQISCAGKEASGTGNMKLMLNGALTLGTRDGANLEIAERVGEENIILFGYSAEEAKRMRGNINVQELIRNSAELQGVISLLEKGFAGSNFREILRSLLRAGGDEFLVLDDFSSYCAAQDRITALYPDRRRFARMSLHNIAAAGFFSADRSIAEYQEKIWR